MKSGMEIRLPHAKLGGYAHQHVAQFIGRIISLPVHSSYGNDLPARHAVENPGEGLRKNRYRLAKLDTESGKQLSSLFRSDASCFKIALIVGI